MKLIGVAGPSSSGKTTLCKTIQEMMPDSMYLCMDDFYKDKLDAPKTEQGFENWDVPGSMCVDEFYSVLNNLKSGRRCNVPIYLISEERKIGYRSISPAEVGIVDGFLLYHEPELATLFDLKIFVDVNLDEQKRRRIERNIDYIPNYFDAVVVPTYNQYSPYMRSVADHILDGNKSRDAVVKQFLSVFKM